MQTSMSGQSYIEYDTGKIIETTYNASVVMTTNLFNESFLLPPAQANSYAVTTQLTDDVMPGQPLPSPTPPPPQQQEASAFLQNVVGLDVGNYTIQSQRTLGQYFYNFRLTSSDSSLQASFNFNNSQVVICRLATLQGSPDFAAPSNSSVDAAMAFLINYQNYSQASYIEPLQSTLGSINDNMNTTVTQGTLSLNVTVSGNVTNFVWTNTENAVDRLALTFQNGSFSFFYVSWT
jgi:hypothetical protein